MNDQPEYPDHEKSNGVKISRAWAMPSRWTFSIKPIKELLSKYECRKGWIDPFAGLYSPAEITNDIENRGATFQMDGLDFLKSRDTNSANGVLFDPPYSVEQCLRKYTPKYKGTVGASEYRMMCKDEIARIIKPGHIAISFGWDSQGICKKRNFEIIEILLVCHGGVHYDTIVTVDRKLSKLRTAQPDLPFANGGGRR